MRCVRYLLASLLFTSVLIGNEREELTSKILEADAQFALLQKRAQKLLHLREEASEDPSELEKEKEYQEQMETFFETFTQLHREGANLASFEAADGYALFAYAYADLTEDFIRFVETNIFPKGWETLLNPDDTVEEEVK